jgi:hypothetical protein
MSSLMEIFEPKCVHRHTSRTHPNCFKDGKPIIIQETKPSKVLLFDIETLPLVAYTFQVWGVNIRKQQIIKDWCVLSWSAKWLNDDKIISDVLTPKEAVKRDDKRLVSSFWNLIEEAHVVVVQNGKKFDIKRMNTRFWKYGLGKPSSYKVIDTLAAAKSTFDLTYNDQDSIAKFIDAQEKMETNFSLWAACDRGESEALNYMLEYNENDVRGLEEIYLTMRDWIPNHPDLRLYAKVDGCPVCLSGNYTKVGIYIANSKKYAEFRCDDCNAIWHSSKAVKEK